jgi:hypothetical protein
LAIRLTDYIRKLRPPKQDSTIRLAPQQSPCMVATGQERRIRLICNSSALPQKPDMEADIEFGHDVPIVLQKSFCTGAQKFCGPWARFSCRDMRGPHRLALNSPVFSVTRLSPYESATGSRSGFSRKTRRPATFDFCNTICH